MEDPTEMRGRKYLVKGHLEAILGAIHGCALKNGSPWLLKRLHMEFKLERSATHTDRCASAQQNSYSNSTPAPCSPISLELSLCKDHMLFICKEGGCNGPTGSCIDLTFDDLRLSLPRRHYRRW